MDPTQQTEPPQSWEEWVGAGAPNGYPARGLPDLSPLFALLDTLRRLVPPELQQQFNALQREVLLTVRALIDWYLERLDGAERAPEVEDIPID
jgi:hypothetical protein